MSATNQSRYKFVWAWNITVLFVGLLGTSPIQAQVLPDQTLGLDQSQVNSISPQQDLIEGGARRGETLFHSFQQFNIGEGQSVYFANPPGIATIFSRVTGNDRSQLLGTLGVAGNASLFFLNPNGIVFGPNARLDISGSFFATTAERFVFGDGLEFSASNPQAPPLLTVNLPVGLQIGENSTVAIENSGTLVTGQDLTLSAGQLSLTGQLMAGRDLTLKAQDTVVIRDQVDTPFVAAAGGNLLVQGNQTVDILALNHTESGLFSGGDLVLRSANPILSDIANYFSGRNFTIQQLNEDLGDLFSFASPIIRSRSDVNFRNYTGTSLHILAGGQVDIESVVIIGPNTTGNNINPMATPSLANITLSNNTSLVIDGSTQQTLDIRAGVEPAIVGVFQDAIGNHFGLSFFSTANSLNVTTADIKIRDIVLADLGIVLLTNQYEPNGELSRGNISISGETSGSIDARVSNGNGSPVFLDSRNGITIEGGVINTSSISGGIGGDIALLAKGNITLNQGTDIISNGLLGGNIILDTTNDIVGNSIFIQSDTFAENLNTKSGSIEINAQNLYLNGGQISASIFGNGIGGDILISTTDSVTLSRGDVRFNGISLIGTGLFSEEIGIGGDVEINAESLYLNDGSFLRSSNSGNGTGGSIQINIRDTLSLDGTNFLGSGSQIDTGLSANATGSAGNIEINTGSLLLDDGADIISSALGQGTAGNIRIISQSEISLAGTNTFMETLNGSSILSTSGMVGETFGSVSGDIEISASSLSLNNGADIASGALSTGNAGNILINVDNLDFNNGSGIFANTIGEGDSGKIEINVAESIIFLDDNSAIDSIVGIGVAGSSQGIEINTGSLFLNAGRIAASTFGEGNSGLIKITAADSIHISEDGIIISSVDFNAEGSSDGIDINTNSLYLNDESQIFTSTFGEGNAGKIDIFANDIINLNGENVQGLPSGIISQVFDGATGDSGGISIQSKSLILNDGTFISASTFGNGDSGEITITTNESIFLTGRDNEGMGSTISSQVGSEAQGSSSGITITTNSISLSDSAQVTSRTSGIGDAGDIKLNIQDSVILSGEDVGIFANTETGSIGQGGDISIIPKPLGDVFSPSVIVSDGASISSDSKGVGIGGNINVRVADLTLDNGTILSETVSNLGGDILLSIDNTLQLRNSSSISSTAGLNQAGGDGGNITINAPFILAFPSGNNDITANAFEGRGGEIQITTQGIFGLTVRDQLTPFNDITASSELGLDGPITIDNPDVDPSQGLTELPNVPAEPRITRSCRPGGNTDNGQFISTGRGGIPPHPYEPLSGNEILGDVYPPAQTETAVVPESQATTPSTKILEAKGWTVDGNGRVTLMAATPRRMARCDFRSHIHTQPLSVQKSRGR